MNAKFYSAFIKSYFSKYLLHGVSVLLLVMTAFFYVDVSYGSTPVDSQKSEQKKTESKDSKLFPDVKDEKNTSFSGSNTLSHSKSNEGIPASYYLQVMFALFLIVALIIAAAWFVKRLNFTSMKSMGSLKIESSLPLGQKEKLIILRVENERILLGVTPHQINFLHKLTSANYSDEDQTKLEPKNFAEKLNTLLARGVK